MFNLNLESPLILIDRSIAKFFSKIDF